MEDQPIEMKNRKISPQKLLHKATMLVKDALIINAILGLIIGFKYLYFPIRAGVLLYDIGLLLYAVIFVSFVSFLKGRYYRMVAVWRSCFLSIFPMVDHQTQHRCYMTRDSHGRTQKSLR